MSIKKDDLEKLCYNLNDEREKVDALIEISRNLEKENGKKALIMGEEAYHLAKRIGYEEGIARSLLAQCYGLRRIANFEKAMTYLYEALPIFEKIQDLEGTLRVLILIGINYFYLGRYALALKYWRKSIKLAKSIGDRLLEASAYNNIGEIYREQQKHKEALEYYKKALDCFGKDEDIESKAGILFNIGLIYHSKGNDKIALEYYNKSLDSFKETEERISEAESLNKIGEIYHNLEMDEKALECYLKSLEILEEQDNRFWQIDVYLNLACIFGKRKRIKKAIEYYEHALAIANELKANRKLSLVHLKFSKFYEELGQWKEALFHYKRHDSIEKQVSTEKLERSLNAAALEFQIEKAQKEAEIYRLKNIELKQKTKEIEEKAIEVAAMNQKLWREISERVEIQKNLEEANKKLERLSTIDALTSISNRRGFDFVIKEEWKNAIKEKKPISVIMVDIDFFKKYNDYNGHIAGDHCLKQIAQALIFSVKNSVDFVGRYGGEEFIIILPNTDKREAMDAAEDMRRKVEELGIFCEEKSQRYNITISLGTATVIPTDEQDIQQFINAADQALYAAKRSGRNKVQSANFEKV